MTSATELREAYVINLYFRCWVLEIKSSLNFMSVVLKMYEICRASEDAADVWLLVNSKPSSGVCVHVCVLWFCRLFFFCGFVWFVLNTCLWPGPKTPHCSQTHTYTLTHTCIPDGQITGHKKTICSRGSITHKHRHPAGLYWDRTVYLRSLLLNMFDTRGAKRLVALVEWNKLHVWRVESFVVKITDCTGS